MDFSGRLRVLLRVPGWLTLKDISRYGRVLLARENEVRGIRAGRPDGAAERDLSWYSWSVLGDISPDGKTIVFTEGGEAGEDHWGVYIRTTDGAPAVRLGDGVFGKLSPDGKWVAALTQYAGEAPTRLVVLPSGAGEIRVLSDTRVSTPHAMWGWLPDGSGILFSAADRDGLRHMAIARLPGGEVSAIPAGGAVGAQASPDGSRFIARGPQGWTVAPVQGGAGAPVRGMQPRWQILGWHTDGRLRVAEIGTERLTCCFWTPQRGRRNPGRS